MLAPKCPACGYDTAGLSEPMCPECASDCSSATYEANCLDRSRLPLRAWEVASIASLVPSAVFLILALFGEPVHTGDIIFILVMAVFSAISIPVYLWIRRNRIRVGAWTKRQRTTFTLVSCLGWGPAISLLLLILPIYAVVLVAFRRFRGDASRLRASPTITRSPL